MCSSDLCSAVRAGENAVDWSNAVAQLKALVATLPSASSATTDLGLDLVEEDEGDELAA